MLHRRRRRRQLFHLHQQWRSLLLPFFFHQVIVTLFFVNILITNVKILIAECEPDTEDPEMKAALKASLLLGEKRSAEDTGALEKRQRSK